MNGANFSGRWRADLESSKLLHAPPKELSIEIDHFGDDIAERLCSTAVNGAERRLLFTCKTTGEEGQSTLDGKPIRGTAVWDGDELVIESWAHLGGGELYFRDYWRLSEGGHTLTMQHRGDALDRQTIVLRKIS